MVVIPGPNCSLAAHIAGTGSSALVLLGGGPGLSSDYLAPLDALAHGALRVVRFDARGVGGSSWPDPARFGLCHHTADVEAVRQFLDVPEVHVLAHSWGGLVAWQYLNDHLDRVASLILVASAAPDEEHNLRAHRRLLARIEVLTRQGFIARGPKQGTAQLHRTFPAYFHDALTPLPDALRATELRETVRRAVLAEAEPAPAPTAFRGPVLIVMGRSDPLGIELAQANAAALTGTEPRVVILEQCGHYPWLEPAAPNACEHELRSFLEPLT